MPWRHLEHPADVRLEIAAESPEALVDECSRAFYDVALGLPRTGFVPQRQPEGERGDILVSGEPGDFADILVVWMNELLFFLEANRRIFVVRRVRIDLADGRLAVLGEWRAAPGTGCRVKAVTYGGLELATSSGWRLRVIMDV